MSPNRSDITAAKISTAARVGIGTSPTRLRQRQQDQQHPDAGEDRRPPAAGPGRDVQRRAADRPADRGAVEEAGRQVGHALADEVAVRPGRRAVRVRRGLRHPRTLDQRDRRDGEGAADHPHGQIGQVRQHQRRQAAGDRPDVGHRLPRSSSPITATTTVGTTTAISVANSASLVRLSRNITASADTPTMADAGDDAGRVGDDVHGLLRRRRRPRSATRPARPAGRG